MSLNDYADQVANWHLWLFAGAFTVLMVLICLTCFEDHDAGQ